MDANKRKNKNQNNKKKPPHTPQDIAGKLQVTSLLAASSQGITERNVKQQF